MAAAAALAQTPPPAPNAGGERLSKLASRMLERTVQARAALDQKDQAGARHFVQEALNNITAMEIERPKAPQPFVVTLYTESVRIAVEKPKGAAQGSANRSQEAPVQQVEGESTRVAVDVTDAKKRLEAARDAIDKNNVQAAAQSLAGIDGDLKAESDVGDRPLIQARENLSLARDDIREQRFADAAVPLRAASTGLGQYAQSHGRHASQAEKLRSEVDALAGSIQQNHANADGKIAAWWREVSGWIQPLNPPPVKK